MKGLRLIINKKGIFIFIRDWTWKKYSLKRETAKEDNYKLIFGWGFCADRGVTTMEKVKNGLRHWDDSFLPCKELFPSSDAGVSFLWWLGLSKFVSSNVRDNSNCSSKFLQWIESLFTSDSEYFNLFFSSFVSVSKASHLIKSVLFSLSARSSLIFSSPSSLSKPTVCRFSSATLLERLLVSANKVKKRTRLLQD